MFHFYTLWKRHKTKGIFWSKWPKMFELFSIFSLTLLRARLVDPNVLLLNINIFLTLNIFFVMYYYYILNLAASFWIINQRNEIFFYIDVIIKSVFLKFIKRIQTGFVLTRAFTSPTSFQNRTAIANMEVARNTS